MMHLARRTTLTLANACFRGKLKKSMGNSTASRIAECRRVSSEEDKSRLVHCLLDLAVLHSRHYSLTITQAEDCSVEFVEHMLGDEAAYSRFCADLQDCIRWLNQCARNFVSNYARAERRRQTHELTYSSSLDLPESRAPLVDPVLRSGFRHLILLAVAELTPAQQDLFLRHALDGESVAEIATAQGKRRNTVQRSLSRIRERLRLALEQCGLKESDLREYLAASPPP
jgi:RNA polymerase sigma factor (sigma-70 family)